jgi:Flp pilus assembly protein TadB
MTEPDSPSRPRIVDVAFWLLVLGAVLLMFAGMLAVSTDFDAVRAVAADSVSDDTVRSWVNLHRAAGVFCILVGLSLAFVGGRTRSGDPRYRRAAIALSAAAVVLVGLLGLFAGLHMLSLLGLVLVAVSAVLWTRPAAADWFGGR